MHVKDKSWLTLLRRVLAKLGFFGYLVFFSSWTSVLSTVELLFYVFTVHQNTFEQYYRDFQPPFQLCSIACGDLPVASQLRRQFNKWIYGRALITFFKLKGTFVRNGNQEHRRKITKHLVGGFGNSRNMYPMELLSSCVTSTGLHSNLKKNEDWHVFYGGCLV